jgi:arginine/lysine/ornithine decarboxylase
LSGHGLAEILREQYGIYVEMETDFFVLCMLTVGHDSGDIRRLLSALRRIAGERAGSAPVRSAAPVGTAQAGTAPTVTASLILRGRPVMMERTPREVFFCERDVVSLARARDRLAANAVTAYPPGVPLIFPGQRLEDEDTRRIEEFRNAGGVLTGLLGDGRIQVCRENGL